MNTTSKIRDLQTKVSNLDTFTQLSILGSWSFIANSAAINAAIKLVPDADSESGIDGYTAYEAARRMAIKQAENGDSPVCSYIALARDIEGMILDADGEARGMEGTLVFLTEAAPTREQFGAEYDNRVRLGMKPGITRRAFIDYEYERAMNQHELLRAKGDDAVRLCQTLTINAERGYGDLPDWVQESFERKLIEKLHARWEKQELTRTNPRRTKQIRDAARADQMLIERLLAEYGETPGFTDDESETAAAPA